MTQIIHNVAAVGIRPDALETYLELHRQQPDSVRQAMKAAHILSYRMYLLRSQNIVISVSSRDAATLAADRRQMDNDPASAGVAAYVSRHAARIARERNDPPSLCVGAARSLRTLGAPEMLKSRSLVRSDLQLD